MAHLTNGLDPDTTQSFVADIERLTADIAIEKARYMDRAREIREEIARVYEDANNQGIRKVPLKAAVKKRTLEARIAALPQQLNGDDLELYELVVEAVAGLEGTPLGDAAVAADRKAGRGRKVRRGEPAGNAPAA